MGALVSEGATAGVVGAGGVVTGVVTATGCGVVAILWASVDCCEALLGGVIEI